MPRILGVDIPNDKPTHISLRYIYGIGPTTALQLCAKAKVNPLRAECRGTRFSPTVPQQLWLSTEDSSRRRGTREGRLGLLPLPRDARAESARPQSPR